MSYDDDNAQAILGNLRNDDDGPTILAILGNLRNDGPTILTNLRKARKCWAWISKVLRAENASPRVSGMFYRATVQAVLLFGSETWNLTGTWLKKLEGFHLRAAWRMARASKPRRNPDGSWVYPPSADTLEEVGLKTIAHYVAVRRQTISDFIRDRPIFGLCVEGERRRGTSPRQWWWEQPMDLDVASEEGGTGGTWPEPLPPQQ